MEDFVDVSKERHSNVWNFFCGIEEMKKQSARLVMLFSNVRDHQQGVFLNTLKEYIPRKLAKKKNPFQFKLRK